MRIVEDSDFRFAEEGYTRTYELDSRFKVSHRILLLTNTQDIPTGYGYDGSFLVEFYDGDELLKSTVSEPKNIYRDRRRDRYLERRGEEVEGGYIFDYFAYLSAGPQDATSVFAFEIAEIPWELIRLRPRRLKTRQLTITVTVREPELDLGKYCDEATLIIIPDLRF